MKLFDCQVCWQTLCFEHARCEGRGHRPGFVPEGLDLHAIAEIDGDSAGTWQMVDDPTRVFALCGNARHGACNWLLAPGDLRRRAHGG